jgi:hypothetical protein
MLGTVLFACRNVGCGLEMLRKNLDALVMRCRSYPQLAMNRLYESWCRRSVEFREITKIGFSVYLITMGKLRM